MGVQSLTATTTALCAGSLKPLSLGTPLTQHVGLRVAELNALPRARRAACPRSGAIRYSRMQHTIEGVLGMKFAMANGDMVTMTLLQGVVNAFVMFLSRAIAFAIAQASRGEREERGGGLNYMVYHLTSFALEIVFMILGSMVVAAFSRFREYRADAGGAAVAGKRKMIAALRALQRGQELVDPQPQPAFRSMQISGHPGGLFRFFSTHPPLESRIERLSALSTID